MVEKRFDLTTVENYKRIIGRCRELIKLGKFKEIEKEFGYPTDSVEDSSGDFLNPDNTEKHKSLDILHFSHDYTNKDAFLYLLGDVEGKDGGTLFYLVRNNNCDVYPIGTYTSIEEFVSAINTEIEALTYYDDLFTKIEQLIEEDDDNMDFIELKIDYSAKIDVDYLFENLDLFLEAYSTPESNFSLEEYLNPDGDKYAVYTTYKMTKDLERLINSR